MHQFFRRIARYDEEFLIHDDGFRGRTFRYGEVARLAESFAVRLAAQGIHKGDTVMIWSESRPGWIVALWGCLLQGVVVVPVEPQSSIDLFRRIEQKVRPRMILVGDRVAGIDGAARIAELEQPGDVVRFEPAAVFDDDLAEIVFTSGTTGEPKGVLITHGNLAAQLAPIEQQFGPYRKYVRPFRPLRILNLLPMSHLFGQALATFVPPLIPASVLFISSTSPRQIVRQIEWRKAAILVAVPKILEVLRDFILHRFPETADTSRKSDAWPRRWWRFRRVHRMLGWKFCCVVSGGAPLPVDLEQFWANLGFVVVQGYGLTETAPVISFTHPFHVQPGTSGKPLEGLEVKIADDGEVLVRGPSVTSGYFEAPQESAGAFRQGWFHTGDIGELDPTGNLIIRGRKKELIVTPEGLKVFPEDVEAVLDHLPGVRESAVIGKERVHAVLVLEHGTDPEEIVRKANAMLEEHQKIRAVSLWAGTELPRTRTTRKLRRGEIAATIEKGIAATAPQNDLAGLIQKYAPGRTIGPETTIEELGLSSLDRVELMMDLEAKFDTNIDERVFTSIRKVGELVNPVAAEQETPFPRYNRSWIARLVRGAALEGILLPLTKMFARRKVCGAEHVESLEGPLIFASNHESHLDTPVILASLPARLRRRIAPAMWKEYFDPHFHPERYSFRKRWGNRILYGLITVLFNGFPIPQTEVGARESIRYMGELVDDGWSILIFPEGERSGSGRMGRFLPGVGMIGSRLRLSVVPVRLRGTGRLLPPGTARPRRGAVEVSFGAPMRLAGESYAELARRVEDAVRSL
ncbi:MAG: AMP-binding protein [Acidobacteriia bacterium]|nr:AMP-binding protein [Terriglobia bacterium]